MVWRTSLPLNDLLRASRPAGAGFFGRATERVARDLVGCLLVAGECAGRIVETEAYLGERDAASHAAPGPTPRNRVMFGPPGFTYVYFIYGMHHCLNFVTERDGVAGAVLLRGLEPLSGIDAMRARRPKASSWHQLANGPGKIALALGLDREHSGLALGNGTLEVRLPRPDSALAREAIRLAVSPRIGIRKCADWPLRFFAAGNPCVSRSPLNASAHILQPGEALGYHR